MHVNLLEDESVLELLKHQAHVLIEIPESDNEEPLGEDSVETVMINSNLDKTTSIEIGLEYYLEFGDLSH